MTESSGLPPLNLPDFSYNITEFGKGAFDFPSPADGHERNKQELGSLMESPYVGDFLRGALKTPCTPITPVTNESRSILPEWLRKMKKAKQ